MKCGLPLQERTLEAVTGDGLPLDTIWLSSLIRPAAPPSLPPRLSHASVTLIYAHLTCTNV